MKWWQTFLLALAAFLTFNVGFATTLGPVEYASLPNCSGNPLGYSSSSGWSCPSSGGVPWLNASASAATGTSYIVGGGSSNAIDTTHSAATYNVVGGGNSNTLGDAEYQTIAGGQSNSVDQNDGTVGGGQSNSVTATFGTIPGGYGNTASGSHATAWGYGSTASGSESMAAGDTSTAGAQDAVALGYENNISGIRSSAPGGGPVTDRGTSGAFIEGGNGGPSASFSNAGRAQSVVWTLWSDYSGASASRLTTNGSSAGSTNVGALVADESVTWNCRITIADKTSPGKVLTYTIGDSLIYQNSNAASTTLGTSNPSAIAGPTAGSLGTLQAVPALTADTSLGSFNLSYTPPSGNTDELYAVAVCRAVEVRYN